MLILIITLHAQAHFHRCPPTLLSHRALTFHSPSLLSSLPPRHAYSHSRSPVRCCAAALLCCKTFSCLPDCGDASDLGGVWMCLEERLATVAEELVTAQASIAGNLSDSWTLQCLVAFMKS